MTSRSKKKQSKVYCITPETEIILGEKCLKINKYATSMFHQCAPGVRSKLGVSITPEWKPTQINVTVFSLHSSPQFCHAVSKEPDHTGCMSRVRGAQVILLVMSCRASSRENLSSEACEQHRCRPACASAQSDQRLCYSLFGKYHI